ncbi:Rho termination factor N-terminal domain-containing protein [Kribbella sp. NPDC054772]
MSDRTIGEQAGDKLEDSVRHAVAGAMDLAARAGVGSGSPDSGKTKSELYADAKRLGIKGRSKMTKAELLKAVRRV